MKEPKDRKAILITAADAPEIFEKIKNFTDIRAGVNGGFIPAKRAIIEMIDAYFIPEIGIKDAGNISRAIKGTEVIKFHQVRVKVDGREFIVIEVGS